MDIFLCVVGIWVYVEIEMGEMEANVVKEDCMAWKRKNGEERERVGEHLFVCQDERAIILSLFYSDNIKNPL